MSGVAVVAFGAISALGEGAAAASAGEVGAPARVAIARDEELVRAGLARPFAARAWPLHADCAATALLERALTSCASELDRVRAGWRGERVGLVLGTSAGGMRAAEAAFAAIARGNRVVDVEAPTYFGPMARASRTLRLRLDPSLLVLGACASAAVAVGLGCRWLSRGACDVVLAGGFDEVTVFVAAGFEALRATTASPPPRPFRLGRDGMALGEGAAVLALARADARPARAFVVGFGAASDAVHLTGPDREGRGLARAAAAALGEAAVLGPDRANDVVVHAFKAQIGHTLGAAGALELLACIDAMDRGLLPASAGEGSIDPDSPARLLDRGVAAAPRTALKLASAFGGANASIVVSSRADGLARPRRSAFVHETAHVPLEPPLEELAASSGTSVDRLARADGLVRLAIAAVARLAADCGPLAGAGVVVGTAFATLETNALFAARLRERGARAAEPRRFPYTSPNAVAGECSIVFGLRGPSFSVGGGMHAAIEAIAAAAVLVEAGDCERMVVVAADDTGPATRGLGAHALRSGAVAVLVSCLGGAGARARIGEITLRRGEPVSASAAPGHLALLPLLAAAVPTELTCASPPDAFARVVLEPA
jgi:3-oxoacyl-[acyl-carrier-protein] synthase II